jgi:hypothetical protein
MWDGDASSSLRWAFLKQGDGGALVRTGADVRDDISSVIRMEENV